MGRQNGARFKISRRLGFSILENNKEFSKGKKREYGPGKDPAKERGRRRRVSPFGKQLIEKQKLRFLYEVGEKQLKTLYKKSQNMQGVASLNMLTQLESRLDNVVFRIGLASTRRQARQLVNHGHVRVEGKKVDIPSFIVKVETTISLSDKAKDFALVKEALERTDYVCPNYVSVNKETKEGKLDRLPAREELNQDINEALVVEYYNRLL